MKKYLQIIEGLLCIFLFTIFLSAFMIDPTQLLYWNWGNEMWYRKGLT
ncbi:hypothetical protein CLOBOL_02962 [Enterocloster bolteae ATCC BAA-613]|uniref:Uncharacterized protein n=1 Tax=Enterocloster bolteae (strain ATCC BAA-613 / DSM 15670 / CCUG 46953 / JCM 12243 / WAL 16351) TaxID=411902 RepID=A8RRA6_ENTBW|nr:hypothetical protein CLOBOL_02962 [Enterocloster bolteae ATCC BAA-613]